MRAKLVFIAVAIFLASAMNLPSCPGVEGLQQQLDQLQTRNAELIKRTQQLENDVKTLNTDMAQVKQILPQLTSVLQSQKIALDQLDAGVKELQKKAVPGRGRRHK